MRKLTAGYLYIIVGFIAISAGAQTVHQMTLRQSEILESGRKYSSWFYSDRLDSLSSKIFNKNYSLKQLKDFRKKVEIQLGSEKALFNEQAGRTKGSPKVYYYIRYSRFSGIDRPVKTAFSFDSSENIFLFSVEGMPKEASSKFHDYKTKTKLLLPFRGCWFAAAGGRTINVNHHTAAPDQRFAYDFLIKKHGASFQNDGTSNDDYFCFNKEIIAPGAGTVVNVVNDIQENKPGDMPKNAGNRIIIDHGNSEYSVLAHFKYNSIAVKEGEQVTSGQFLGLCGNSGHSSEAHLHYHLQNTPVMFKGEGLPLQFQSFWADGKYFESGEPVGGQYVENK